MRYLRELKADDPVRVTFQLLDYDTKRMHYFEQLFHATEGLGVGHLGEHVAARRHDGEEDRALSARCLGAARAHVGVAPQPAATGGGRPPDRDAQPLTAARTVAAPASSGCWPRLFHPRKAVLPLPSWGHEIRLSVRAWLILTSASPSRTSTPPAPAPGGIAARARANVAAPYLNDLNPEQRLAVETLDGPVLVLAGAGTGKTRVLTTRIAHILNLGRARPGEILAVTFTNKAAREMKHRVGTMVGQIVEGMPWLGTFHSIGVKLLRRHAELVGLKPDFSILDIDDQIRLLRSKSSKSPTSTRNAGRRASWPG